MFVKHLEEMARIFFTELSFIKGYNSVKCSTERDFDGNVPNMEGGSLVLFRKKEFDQKLRFFNLKQKALCFVKACKRATGLHGLVFIPRQNKEKFQIPGNCHEMEVSLLGQRRNNS